MKKEYLDPFVEAALKVSQDYFGGKAKIVFEEREKNIKMDKDIIVALGVREQLKGLALFGINNEDAVIMAKRAFVKMGGAEEYFDPNDKESIYSAMQEFGNWVVGYAANLYSERNYRCEITVPNIIKAEQLGAFPYECVKLELENEKIMEIKIHLVEG